MKKTVLIAFLLLLQIFSIPVLHAQNEKTAYMLRLYEDNDFLNDMGRGTDEAYTNGTRIDLFYTGNHRSILDRWMPRAGDSSINIYALSIVEMMYTPSDIVNDCYQPHDYSWAGALYTSHTLYSYNPQKKYDFQTEVLAGIMGPHAFAKPLQQTAHHLIDDPSIPQGWDNQFGDDILLNINFTAEQQLMHIGNYIELVGSGQVLAGTMTDAIDMSLLLRVGKMQPYFNGFIQQKTTGKKGGRVQVYFKVKPGVQLVAWNSMLEGGMFNQKPDVKVAEAITGNADTHGSEYMQQPVPTIENVVTYLSYGAVVAAGPLSISYTQTHTTELVKNTYSHTYGNISVSYIW